MIILTTSSDIIIYQCYNKLSYILSLMLKGRIQGILIFILYLLLIAQIVFTGLIYTKLANADNLSKPKQLTFYSVNNPLELNKTNSKLTKNSENINLQEESKKVINTKVNEITYKQNLKNQPSTILVPVIMYHHIESSAGIDNAIEKGLRVHPDVFDKQMEYLKTNNYTTILSSDLSDYQFKGKPLPEKPIILTFDDGYLNNYEKAFPILKKHEMKGEFAIITGMIGNSSYMNWDQIRDLVKGGMGISSHTVHHCYLAGIDQSKTKETGNKTYLATPIVNLAEESSRKSCPSNNFAGVLNSEQVTEELRISKKVLEKETGFSIKALVYPFGNFNQEVKEIAKDLGYEYGYTVIGQKNEKVDLNNPFEISRYRAFGQESLPLTNFFAGNR
jgi:peptidoglycan/xylan/chitin deacetylase (PgdA/CDA1 family)